MKKILITGGMGFIGSNLCEKLKKNNSTKSKRLKPSKSAKKRKKVSKKKSKIKRIIKKRRKKIKTQKKKIISSRLIFPSMISIG